MAHGANPREPKALDELAAEAARSVGVEVVDLVVRNQGPYSVIRIDIDRAGPRGVTIEDCEAMSRAFDALLEAHGELRERHELQVSSPGVDRPIRTDDDIRRNTGRMVAVEISEPLEGARVLRGTLGGLHEGSLRLVTREGREVFVPRSTVILARQEIDIGRHRARRTR